MKAEFYNFTITKMMENLSNETLSASHIENLIEAHFSTNYSTFGSIDKTLSGFFILSNNGDDYTLLDRRDSQQIFVQSHEDRQLNLCFDGLKDYAQTLLNQGDGSRRRVSPKKKKGKRVVSTPELLRRYQWMVWCFAKPLREKRKDIQTMEELIDVASRIFSNYWKNSSQINKAFKKELPSLSKDPHLAIYWIIHSGFFNDNEKLADIKKRIKGPSKLVREVTNVFGVMEDNSTFITLKDFRRRRGYFFWRLCDGFCEVDLIQSISIDSKYRGFERAECLLQTYEASEFSQDLIVDLVKQDPKSHVLRYLKFVLEKRGDRVELASIVKQAAKQTPQITSEIFDRVMPYIRATKAAKAEALRLFLWDPFHPTTIKLCHKVSPEIPNLISPTRAMELDLWMSQIIDKGKIPRGLKKEKQLAVRILRQSSQMNLHILKDAWKTLHSNTGEKAIVEPARLIEHAILSEPNYDFVRFLCKARNLTAKETIALILCYGKSTKNEYKDAYRDEFILPLLRKHVHNQLVFEHFLAVLGRNPNPSTEKLKEKTLPLLSKTQVEKLYKVLVGKATSHDKNALAYEHRLGDFAAMGIETTIVEEINRLRRNLRYAEVMRAQYFSLNENSLSVQKLLTTQLFIETRCYSYLKISFHTNASTAFHRRIFRALDLKKDAHAAAPLCIFLTALGIRTPMFFLTMMIFSNLEIKSLSGLKRPVVIGNMRSIFSKKLGFMLLNTKMRSALKNTSKLLS